MVNPYILIILTLTLYSIIKKRKYIFQNMKHLGENYAKWCEDMSDKVLRRK